MSLKIVNKTKIRNRVDGYSIPWDAKEGDLIIYEDGTLFGLVFKNNGIVHCDSVNKKREHYKYFRWRKI